MNVTELNETFVHNQTFGQPGVNYMTPGMIILDNVMGYAVLTLGITGNIMSMIVWMRHQVVAKNSSAVYLTALAINVLVCLLMLFAMHVLKNKCEFWACGFFPALTYLFTALFEPQLVLAFSVERLIVILRPLQIRCLRLHYEVIMMLPTFSRKCTPRCVKLCIVLICTMHQWQINSNPLLTSYFIKRKC